MKLQPRYFLLHWILACTALSTLIIIFNAVIDPYLVLGMPRIAGVNAHKPAVETQEQMVKAYDVLRASPNTLILGSSMVDWGLDALDPVWAKRDRPVYNLGLEGSGPYASYRYLQHVLARRDIGLVVLAVDFIFFLDVSDEAPVEDDAEARLSLTPNGDVNPAQRWQHLRDLLHATTSFDVLTDSIATVEANAVGGFPDIVQGNVETIFPALTAETGPYPIVGSRDLYWIRRYAGKRRNPLTMKTLGAILSLCQDHGVRVVLLINPAHADELEIFDRLGYWQEFEAWKRDLVSLAGQYTNPDGSGVVPLWDFSGYNSYSTEPVLANHREPLRWFWDSGHYKRVLGNIILSRIFGGSNEDFGTLLTKQNLESHLLALREQRRAYRERYPNDVNRVRYLYESATTTLHIQIASNHH